MAATDLQMKPTHVANDKSVENARKLMTEKSAKNVIKEKAAILLHPSIFSRTHIIGLICYLLFLGISAIIFSLIEDISFLSSLYFIIVTQATVGYGDIVPETNGGLIFNFFFVIISFAVIVVIFNLIFDFWFDSKIESLCSEIQGEAHKRNIIDQKHDGKKQYKRIYFIVYLLIYIFWLIIWIIFFCFHPDENLTFWESIYFGIVTSTTIGYGVYHPKSSGGRLFVFFFIYFGIISLGTIVTSLSDKIKDIIMKNKSKKKANNTTHQQRKLRLMFLLNRYNNKKITKNDFVVDKLLQQKKITENDINQIMKEFNELDVDNNGVLDKNDLDQFEKTNSV